MVGELVERDEEQQLRKVKVMAKATKVKEVNSDKAKAFIASKLAPKSDFLNSPTKRMLINVSPMDEKGKKAPQNIGTFHIVGTDLYSDTILFRPIAYYNKLMKVVQSKTMEGKEIWATVNETVFFTNYSDMLYDKKGGIACGKIFGEARKALSKAELDANNEKAKSFMFVFGLATFPDSDEQHFVDFRIGGKRIIEASNAFSSKTIGKNHIISEFNCEMTLNPTSKGVHPDLSITVDLDNPLPVDDIIEYDEKITDYIDKHNARIMASYKKYSEQSNAISEDADISIDIGEDE